LKRWIILLWSQKKCASKASLIITQFVDKEAIVPIDIREDTRNEILKAYEASPMNPPASLFHAAAEEALGKMTRELWPIFMRSEAYVKALRRVQGEAIAETEITEEKGKEPALPLSGRRSTKSLLDMSAAKSKLINSGKNLKNDILNEIEIGTPRSNQSFGFTNINTKKILEKDDEKLNLIKDSDILISVRQKSNSFNLDQLDLSNALSALDRFT